MQIKNGKLPPNLCIYQIYSFDGSSLEKGMHMHMRMENMHISIIIMLLSNFFMMLPPCSVSMSVL